MSHSFDPVTPSPARIYDYLLGGKDHFPADREAAEAVRQAFPDTERLARANRQFLVTSVEYCAALGIRQFIDIGTGIPTAPTVADIARQGQPDARIVGVDNDPVVLAHDRAMVETRDGVRIIEGDVRQPEEILSHPVTQEVIDFEKPVAVLLVALLHFVSGTEAPRRIMRAFSGVLAPGSRVVLSHACSSDSDVVIVQRLAAVYARATSPAVFRSAAEIRDLFEGLRLVDPGLVDVQDWPRLADRPSGSRRVRVLGGVGACEAGWC